MRVDGFSKMRAIIFPFSELDGYPYFLNLLASSIISITSSFFIPVNSRKCFVMPFAICFGLVGFILSCLRD